MKLRITEVLYRLRLFFIPYLIILATCLLIKLTHSREDIYWTVNHHHYYFFDNFFSYATDLGNGIAAVIIIILLLLYNYRHTFLMATSFLLTSLVAQIIKRIFHSPRPSLYFKDQVTHIYFVKGIKILSTNSFPSGHSVQAFTIAVVVAYIARQKRWGFIALLFAIFVAYSRMYLSQHFFEDVTAGSIIGTMTTIIWLTIIDSKPFLHSPKWNRGLLKKTPHGG